MLSEGSHPKRAHPLRVFAMGMVIRLVGLLLIWLGDGHTSLISKVVVVVGVILSIGGIAILKWLSFQPRRKRAPSAATR
jgi:hypothetical protein